MANPPLNRHIDPRMQTFKNIKNFLMMLGVNADPVIFDVKFIFLRGFTPTDFHHRTTSGLDKFNRITDKIKKYSRDFNAVTNDFGHGLPQSQCGLMRVES